MAGGRKRNISIMPISTKTLFHFLSKGQFLIDTLERGFWPRYTIEYYWGGKHLAIPMVCFCDIPLSQIAFHIEKYGGDGYGIGMSKHWALEKGITPVLYSSYKNEFLYEQIRKYAEGLRIEDIATNASSLCMEQRLLYYAKRVTESSFDLKLRNQQAEREEEKREKKYKYYNEREWRYVPQISEDVHLEIIDLNDAKQKLKLEQKKKELSERTKGKWLEFTIDNVEYIFVPNDEQRKAFIKVISEKFKGEEDKILSYISKIITVEQIRQDF